MKGTTAPIEAATAVAWSEGVREHGGPERERFVLAHAPLVRYVAQRILSRLPASVELADLVNDGLVGLIEAIDRFDPARGVRFGSFAEARVRGAILDALRAKDAASRSLRRRLRDLDVATSRAEQKLGRAPSEEDLAAELEITTGELAKLRTDREAARPAPTDPRLTETQLDSGFRSHAPDPFEQVAEAELLERLAKLVEQLPERERLILALYYDEGLTLREIGEVLSVTESRVCQIHGRSLRALEAKLGARAPVATGGGRRS